MKKFYFLIAIAFALATFSAQAQNRVLVGDTYTDDNGIEYTYTYDNWALQYDDSEEMTWIVTNGLAVNGHAEIANEIDGIKVRIIGAGAFRNWDDFDGGTPNLTSITLPDNVEIIQMAAFLGCINLKKIDLNNVHRIDYAAFTNCSSLEEIHIRKPASQVRMGFGPFSLMVEGGFGTEVIPATIYVPQGELQNYIDKFANPYEEPEDPMMWEENALYEFYKAGRLKEEGDGPSDPLPGDATGDGIVDVEDVNNAINMILHLSDSNNIVDMNGDGIIDVEDINAIINIILKL